MDLLYVTYIEETEELLQKAEECLIRLEAEYSTDDINGLFRMFHSIKGSSQMIGYEDIGNLTHKMEDMLDIVRKGRIDLDGKILQLCFRGLDHVKRLFESKKNMNAFGDNADFIQTSLVLEREIDQILKANSETGSDRKETSPGDGIITALKESKQTGKNRYCIYISFSDDIPMISPVLFMIFNNIKDIGSLVYTNVSDGDIYEASVDLNISAPFMIMDSDLEAAELYTYFDLMYVKKIAISDISEHQMLKQAIPHDRDSRRFFENFFQEYPKLYPVLFHHPNSFDKAVYTEFIHEWYKKIFEVVSPILFHATGQSLKQEIETFYDWCLHAIGGTLAPDFPCKKYLELFEMVYGYVRGRFFYKIFKAKNDHFIDGLAEFIERMDKSSTREFLLDLSGLEMIHEHELKSLIELKRRLSDMGIVVSVIIDNPSRRRLINIFDSIRTIEKFEWFETEVDAALGENITSMVNLLEDDEMSGYRIMILDDETEILDLLKKNFQSAGYTQIETYIDPATALEMFKKRKYHIVLADINMQEIDGIEFLNKVKDYDPMTQVIIMTGCSTMDRILTCLELGANDYILKPFKSYDYVLEVVDDSIKKLERWREAIKGMIATS
ncbi:response regulator [Aneurinibacillus terranovensis]|uniref:response regulator n=1 Tax=Aneurinibacillus terranovensis TaxID=278991 RepID=UPI000428EE50|nr:response regulator [Aneurinibacillus terranovensis]